MTRHTQKNWLPKSPDCNPLDYYFCDRVQEKVYNGRYCSPLNLVELSLQFFLCLSNMFLKNLGLPMTSSISDIYSKVGCRLIDTNFLTI